MSSLFTGDVKSNIRLNEESITDEQVIEAAKYVNADGFISQLEGGYDHRVIERGAAFPPGSGRLLSFARTLAFSPLSSSWTKPPPTSIPRPRPSSRMLWAKLMEGRTTIIVAHRLSHHPELR